jgi:hypothetical protein
MFESFSFTPKMRGLAAAAFTSLMLVAPVGAATVYESATYTGVDNGDYTLSNNDIIGAAFQIIAPTQVTAIGAQFGCCNGGTIFGAIIPLASLTAVPSVASNSLNSVDLAHTVFSVPSLGGFGAQQQSVPLSVILQPGFYAVVFGSGQFGASGFAGLGQDNTLVGSPEFIRSFFDTDWSATNDPVTGRFSDGMRIFVEGDAISETPLPAAMPMFAGGAGLLGWIGLRRRRKAV